MNPPLIRTRYRGAIPRAKKINVKLNGSSYHGFTIILSQQKPIAEFSRETILSCTRTREVERTWEASATEGNLNQEFQISTKIYHTIRFNFPLGKGGSCK